MEYKISKEMKLTFALSALLLFIAVILKSEVMFGVSVIIFVVLDVAVEILKAIHNMGGNRGN